MAKNVGTVNTSQFSNLRSELAQGADVGDRGYDYNGNEVRWTGANWESTGGGGGGGGGSSSYPTFNFDWTQARADAMTQLTPYYEQKLKEAGGDVERAKRLIEEDYMRGVRYSKEDLTRENIQGEENAATAFKTLGLDVTEENRSLAGSLNQRNVLLGTIPQGDTGSAAPMGEYAKSWFINPQTEKQTMRKMAIERALKRQKEGFSTTAVREQEGFTTRRARDLEEENIQFPRTTRDLEEEKRRRAFETAVPMAYSEQYARYKALNNLG